MFRSHRNYYYAYKVLLRLTRSFRTLRLEGSQRRKVGVLCSSVLHSTAKEPVPTSHTRRHSKRLFGPARGGCFTSLK